MAEMNKPLAGKRVVVTRAREQADELIRMLENMGAEVIPLPVVAFGPPEDWGPLDKALRRLSDFDAILFLSRNAVRYVAERCRELRIKCAAVMSPDRLVAVVGPATAQAAAREGLRVDYVAQDHTGESLVRELRLRLEGRSVLLPRSDRGDARISSALREAGACVTEVVAYRTVANKTAGPAILSCVRRGDADAIVFASPSAFLNFAAMLGEAETKEGSARIHFAALGPTTARAMREFGARVDIEVNDRSAIGVGGIVNALVRFFQQRSTAAPARSA